MDPRMRGGITSIACLAQRVPLEMHLGMSMRVSDCDGKRPYVAAVKLASFR